MRIGIAIWPQNDAEWLELGLASKLGAEVDMIGGSVRDPVAPLDLIILDGEHPGPFFLGYYRALTSGFGMPPLIVLGDIRSPALKPMEWDAAETVFVPKPYEIESVLKQVLKIMDTSGQVADSGNGNGPEKKSQDGGSNTLGYLSTLALSDLVQMLCISDWTGMICVEHLSQGTEGYLYISDGNLYHARAGSLSGLQACYHMLRWGRCKYSFDEEKVLDEFSIKLPWQEVMLEGARQIDEAG
jgi:hypothetical protein